MKQSYKSSESNRARSLKWYHANKERFVQNQRDKRKRNPITVRNQEKRYRYKLTALELYTMRKTQNNLCAICGKIETAKTPNRKETRDLSIDHDHRTGSVRGLLCSRCNTAIGFFSHDTVILARAINYLRITEN